MDIRSSQAGSDDRRWLLVADGDEDGANVLAGLLLHHRFRAYPTGRGAEALRVAATHPLGLAVVDLSLRDMPGPDLVRRLRQIDSKLPVVVTSADLSADAERRARELGILRYVHKPYDPRRIAVLAAKLFALPPVAGPRLVSLGLSVERQA